MRTLYVQHVNNDGLVEGLTSPYPTAGREQGNAPIRENFRDAKDVLKTVRQSRHVLESNLQAIWRSRQESDIFTLLEQLSSDRWIQAH